MMCYRDKTYCEFYQNCKDGNNCHRSLTPDVKRDADKWWGKPGAPISVFTEKPSCFLCVSRKGDSLFEGKREGAL